MQGTPVRVDRSEGSHWADGQAVMQAQKTKRFPWRPFWSAVACGMAAGSIGPPALGAQEDSVVGNEYRLTLSPHHAIKGDLIGFSQLEYRDNPEQDYRAYQVLWPGLTYSVRAWFQLSGGLLTRYTDNGQSADTLELRPFAGVQFLVANTMKWNFYNATRYEFRDTEDLTTHEWTGYGRLRSRFGIKIPLTAREQAWQSKTWYALAEVEPCYRFDDDTIDPLFVRGGIGRVLSDRIRLELVYSAQFTRSNEGPLQYSNNIFQLNIKLGLGKGILQRALHGEGADD